METTDSTIIFPGKKTPITYIDSPNQLTFLKEGERISTNGLVKSMTHSEKMPSLPNEFVIRNKNNIIETIKETNEGIITRSIYQVKGNSLQNFNQILYNKIKPLSKYYREIYEGFQKI